MLPGQTLTLLQAVLLRKVCNGSSGVLPLLPVRGLRSRRLGRKPGAPSRFLDCLRSPAAIHRAPLCMSFCHMLHFNSPTLEVTADDVRGL